MKPALLIVGLGNPGHEYEETRHNFGFHVLDRLAEIMQGQAPLSVVSSKKDPFVLMRGQHPKATGPVFLLKPLTYMNRSGEAVQPQAAYYRIPPENIFVVHDEIDLPLGTLRLKKGGGNAGHNGLKSIQQCLGTPEFYRLRLGIGRPEHQDVASYVLSRFMQAEWPAHKNILEAALEGIARFLEKGERSAQQFCNSIKPPHPELSA